jgi:outer membrane lipoprotein-sorting protein
MRSYPSFQPTARPGPAALATRRNLLALLLLCAPLLASAAALDIDGLMKLLARTPSGEATFVEKRHVAQLDQPLESSGRLSFVAPDVFVRETLKPRRERIAVNGNTVVMSQGSRSRTVQLDATPEASVIVEAVRGTLSGNRAVLDKYFAVQGLGSLERWQLELVPRDARMRGQVASIRVVGLQGQLREVTVVLADGDRSVMTITPVETPLAPAAVSGAAAADTPASATR